MGCTEKSRRDHRGNRLQYARLRLQVADKHFTSNVEQVHSWKAVIARLYFMSSMTEVAISEVFKRSVLWDHRIKNCHNRNFVDKEWRNLSHKLKISSTSKYYYVAFLFVLYKNLCTDMQKRVHVIS
jgi:hypothetical protein